MSVDNKKVGSGAAEYYIVDGDVVHGVFNAGGTVKYWNILAGGEVMGRVEASGTRYYYQKDLLGSTRLAFNGSGTSTHHYDFYPFGLISRATISGTEPKEKFTGKERDAETTLDYFGARYYMAAVGRWASVDPLAEKFPAWSSYNYVLNNPESLFDPDGAEPCCLGGGQIALMIKHTRAILGDRQSRRELKEAYSEIGRSAVEVAADTYGDAFELVTGKTVTLREGNRKTAAVALMIPFVSSRALKALDAPSDPRAPVDLVQTNRSAGILGEDFLRQAFGGGPKAFQTSEGWRYVDNLVDGVAMESKVGRVYATTEVLRQVRKDAELL